MVLMPFHSLALIIRPQHFREHCLKQSDILQPQF